MWSLGRWLGCVLVTLGVVDLAWTVPATFGHPTWNPAFGLPFLITSVVLAYAVGLGRFGWWPVLAFHEFGSRSDGAVLRHDGSWPPDCIPIHRSLALRMAEAPTVVVGRYGCADPLLDSNCRTRGIWILGNLSNVLKGGGHEAHFGIEYGLRSLGFIIWPRPAPIHQWSLSVYYNSLGSVPVVAGLVVLGVLLTVAVAAWRFGLQRSGDARRYRTCVAGCVVLSFAAAPRADGDALSWLDPVLWLVGFLTWLVVFWAAFEVIRARKRVRVTMKAPLSLMLCVVAGVLVVMDVIGLWRLPGQSSVNAEQNAQLANVVRAVESVDRPGMVSVEFSPTPTPPLSLFRPIPGAEFDDGQALLWQLTAAGYEPVLTQPFFTQLSGIIYPHGKSSAIVHVIMNGTDIEKVVIGKTDDPRPHG